MSSKVAQGMATTGPDDSLVAVDAHGSTPDQVISRYKKQTSEIGVSALDGVSKSMLDPKNISDMIKVEDGNVGLDSGKVGDLLTDSVIDAAEQKRRLDGVAGVNLRNIPGVGADQSRLAEALLGGLVDENYADLIDGTGDIIRIGAGVDTGSASSMVRAIARFADVDAFQDVVDQNAWLATGLSYLDGAIKLGIPAAIDSLMNKLKDDRKAREQLIASVRSVILRGDIATLNKIISWTSAQSVMEKVPDACYLLLSCYRFERNTKPSAYPQLRTELLAVLNVLDEQWDTEVRNGSLVPALEVFARVSSDAKKLLQLSSEYDVQLMVAPRYRTVDLVQSLSHQYPVISVWLRQTA